jgi:hypothetical protein
VCRRFPTTGQEATTSTARRIHGSTIACVLLAFAMTSAATARALHDLRSPDARDLAQTPGMFETMSAPPQDLRSPDARDAAAGRGTFNAPDVISPQVFTDRQRAIVKRFKRSPSYQQALRETITAVNLSQAAPVRSDHGIDWGDAGIGAASPLGAIALGLASAMTILQHRRQGRQTAPVA